MIFCDISDVLILSGSKESSENKRNENLIQILRDAKNTLGLKIVYTTNNSSRIEELLPKYELQSLPDLIVSSSTIGVLKPSPEYWSKAFDLSKNLENEIKFEEILVVDDSHSNIESAKNYGFKAIQYFGPQTDQEIIKLLNQQEGNSTTILKNESDIEKYINSL